MDASFALQRFGLGPHQLQKVGGADLSLAAGLGIIKFFPEYLAKPVRYAVKHLAEIGVSLGHREPGGGFFEALFVDIAQRGDVLAGAVVDAEAGLPRRADKPQIELLTGRLRFGVPSGDTAPMESCRRS